MTKLGRDWYLTVAVNSIKRHIAMASLGAGVPANVARSVVYFHGVITCYQYKPMLVVGGLRASWAHSEPRREDCI
jgi:hypothetical protein